MVFILFIVAFILVLIGRAIEKTNAFSKAKHIFGIIAVGLVVICFIPMIVRENGNKDFLKNVSVANEQSYIIIDYTETVTNSAVIYNITVTDHQIFIIDSVDKNTFIEILTEGKYSNLTVRTEKIFDYCTFLAEERFSYIIN